MTTYDQAVLVAQQIRDDETMMYVTGIGVEPDSNYDNNWVIRAYIRKDLYDMMGESVRANYYIDNVKIVFSLTGSAE